MIHITPRLWTLLGLGALILGTATGQHPKADLADPTLDYVPGEILVRFEPGVPAGLSKQLAEGLGAKGLRDLGPSGLQRWKLPPGLSVEGAVSLFTRSGLQSLVRYAEPNYLLRAHGRSPSVVPDDLQRGELWNLHNIGQTGGTPDADIDALDAWQYQTGSHQVVVAIIDSGIDYLHEDLAANIWVHPGEIPGNQIDDDGNGYVDDVQGWDFVNDDADPMDDNGHGTFVAGIVGAVGDNGIGTTGVCWNVSLMALKFMDGSGTGTVADAVLAIDYAASLNVPILNNSWGSVRRSRALKEAIGGCGALFVVSAGNKNSSKKTYPAGYDLENIISVSATTPDDTLSWRANTGTWVDLGAPGQDIYSTLPGDIYGMLGQDPYNSVSVPHVSGVAALLLADSPGLGILDVKAAILTGVDPIPALQGMTLTGGRLNAVNALGGAPLPADAVPPTPISDLTVDLLSVTEEGMTLTWTATGDDGTSGTAWLYDLRYLANVPITGANWEEATPAGGEPLPQAPGAPETLALTGLVPSTTYYVALVVMDEMGNSSLSNVVGPVTTAGPPPGAFLTEVVDSGGVFAVGRSLAFDPSGNPGVAYRDDDTGEIKFAHWNGATWEKEVVDVGEGPALAFSPSGHPAISYCASGKAKFAEKIGASWDIHIIDNSNTYAGCLVYDASGNPCVTYGKTNGNGAGVRYATRIGSTWSSELVDAVPHYGGQWQSLALNPTTGQPAIAFSAGLGQYIDTLKFAQRNGSSWDVEIVETGPPGYGVRAALAFNPTNGYPTISHGNDGFVRLLRWDGTAWQLEIVGSDKAHSLAYDSSGTLFILRRTSTDLEVLHWDGSSWQTEAVDPGVNIPYFSFSFMTLDPFERPAVIYTVSLSSTAREVKLARKPAP